MGKVREAPGQRLPCTVAEGTNIDTTVRTGHTERVEPETFPGGIPSFAGDKEERAMEAKKYTDGGDELSFCIDSSEVDSGYTEASIAWCNTELRTQKTYLSTNKEALKAELYAIGKALKIALKNG